MLHSVIALTSGVLFAASPPLFSRSTKFEPVQVAPPGLRSLVQRTRDVVAQTNKSPIKCDDEKLELTQGSLSISLTDCFPIESLDSAPQRPSDFRYVYSGGNEQAISAVRVTESAAYSVVEVTGRSLADVDTLHMWLAKKLAELPRPSPSANPPEQRTSNHSRSADYGPMRLSHEDLMNTIGRARTLVGSANKDDQPCRGETIRIASGSSVVGYGGCAELADLSNAPPLADALDYELKGGGGHPLSYIEISLGDYRRQVTVRGTSADQVEATLGALGQHLEAYGGVLGGSRFRLIAGLCFWAVAILLWSIPFVYKSLSTEATIGMQGSAFLLVVSVWILPWEGWLPGTAIFARDSSFLSRNSPLITAIGTGLGLPVVFAGLRSAVRLIASKLKTERGEEPPSTKIQTTHAKGGVEGASTAGAAAAKQEPAEPPPAEDARPAASEVAPGSVPPPGSPQTDAGSKLAASPPSPDSPKPSTESKPPTA